MTTTDDHHQDHHKDHRDDRLPEPTMTDPLTTTYSVTGMTCAHCVAAVTEEVREVPGVEAVEVDLARGQLRVSGADEIEVAAVLAAVDEAGYTAVPA